MYRLSTGTQDRLPNGVIIFAIDLPAAAADVAGAELVMLSRVRESPLEANLRPRPRVMWPVVINEPLPYKHTQPPISLYSCFRLEASPRTYTHTERVKTSPPVLGH